MAQNGVAKRMDVETGIFDMELITVLSGLSTEDTLITSWSANLREGAEVSVQMTADSGKDSTETAADETDGTETPAADETDDAETSAADETNGTQTTGEE